jgi:hypothetical protein
MVALFDFPSESLRTWKLKSCEDEDDEDHVVALMVCLTSLSMIAVVAVCLIIAGRLAMFLHSRHQASYLNSHDPS